jgi:hypothetical protein
MGNPIVEIDLPCLDEVYQFLLYPTFRSADLLYVTACQNLFLEGIVVATHTIDIDRSVRSGENGSLLQRIRRPDRLDDDIETTVIEYVAGVRCILMCLW